ncbi:hypothetical protein ACRAKI_22980 [Saccharothrix isguenensis]
MSPQSQWSRTAPTTSLRHVVLGDLHQERHAEPVLELPRPSALPACPLPQRPYLP